MCSTPANPCNESRGLLEGQLETPKRALVVCGPTAAGKSDIADTLAERLTLASAKHVPTLVVDSMQVYKELPVITNQARRRPAELVGIISVSEEWTVARHRAQAEMIISREDTFVLDSGTGMYLNAILLDLALAPRVPGELRARAQEETAQEPNPRRAARQRELELAGVDERGSIWAGSLRYATTLLYLRPDRSALDAAIARRSRSIAREGLKEASEVAELAAAGVRINPSVLESVGVRELTRYAAGEISLQQAEDLVATRTRRLARRQLRWFDKLARALEDRADVRVRVVQGPLHNTLHNTLHNMHDILRA